MSADPFSFRNSPLHRTVTLARQIIFRKTGISSICCPSLSAAPTRLAEENTAAQMENPRLGPGVPELSLILGSRLCGWGVRGWVRTACKTDGIVSLSGDGGAARQPNNSRLGWARGHTPLSEGADKLYFGICSGIKRPTAPQSKFMVGLSY
jgi:hypothetical protein